MSQIKLKLDQTTQAVCFTALRAAKWGKWVNSEKQADLFSHENSQEWNASQEVFHTRIHNCSECIMSILLRVTILVSHFVVVCVSLQFFLSGLIFSLCGLLVSFVLLLVFHILYPRCSLYIFHLSLWSHCITLCLFWLIVSFHGHLAALY